MSSIWNTLMSLTVQTSHTFRTIISVLLSSSLIACGSQTPPPATSIFEANEATDVTQYDLDDIQRGGELIVLTLYGPSSFFEFRGESFGAQYMIVKEYANSIGVTVRVDVSHSVDELIGKLKSGEGDIVATGIDINDSISDEIEYIGQEEICSFLDSLAVQQGDTTLTTGGNCAWAVRNSSQLLASSLSDWMADNRSEFGEYTTIRIRTKSGKVYAPRRKVSSPILDPSRGIISHYDVLFKRYAQQCGWDWRLLAAQGYQESAFDPEAVSWMGAMGLMQLMPSTAREVGVSQDDVFVPEANLRGAVRLISKLNAHYQDIHDPSERINFILAAYNAGSGHVDDARMLAKRNGKNPNVWLDNVDYYVLHMSERRFYNQPGVQHGYFRGSETYNYVNSIRTRWDNYKKV